MAALVGSAFASSASGQEGDLKGFGQTFSTSGENYFLASVFTGSLEATSAGFPYTYDLFAVSGLTLTGGPLFTQAFTGPLGPNQTVEINLLLDPLATYAFLLRTGYDGQNGGMLVSTSSMAVPTGEAIDCTGTSCVAMDFFGEGSDINDFAVNLTAGSPPPTSVVPEPVSILLLGTGLLGLGPIARRRRRLPGETNLEP